MTTQRVAGGLAFLALVNGQEFDSSTYERNSTLHDDLDVYWTVDSAAATFRVAVHAKAATGWAGFGFTEMGGMEGSDIVYYEASTGNITDAHALVAGKPVTDECTQDWTLISAEVDATNGLVFEAERPLETSDPQDRVLLDDTLDGVAWTRIIAAWGDGETIEYHGTNVGKDQVVLFSDSSDASVDPLSEIKSDNGSVYFDVIVENFTIPAVRTFYKDTCLHGSDLPAGGEFHAIGFEGVIHNETEEFVHHLVLTGYYDSDNCWTECASSTSIIDTYGGNTTFSSTSSTYTADCEGTNFDDIYAWAPGAPALATPDDVGFRFGFEDRSFQSVGIQTHYNNPDLIEGLQDNSGVRVYYTEDFRDIDAGVMKLGDPFVVLRDVEIPDGKSQFTFRCHSNCSSEYFEEEEVTVFGHFLHMHATGMHMITNQFRDDVLINTAHVEYYSFDQAGGFVTAENTSETMKRGDRFETHCYYDTAYAETDDGTVVFGSGSEDEMCVDFTYYYPAQPIPFGACSYPVCGNPVDVITELEADSTMNRTYGIVETTCADALGEDADSELSSEPSASSK